MVALLLALTIRQDPLQKPVTFTSLPARAEIVCLQLSEATGVKLATNSVTAEELLTIRVKDVPLQSLMQRIAEVTSCQWQEERGSYRLVRPPSIEAAEKKAEQEWHLARTRISLLKAAEAAGKLEPFTPALADTIVADTLRNNAFRPEDDVQWSVKYERYRALAGKSPLQRAVTRLAALFDPDLLATWPQGRQYTFAHKPARMQFPMPKGADEVMRQFVVEQRVWSQSAENAPPDPFADRHSSYDINVKAGSGPVEASMVLAQVTTYGVGLLEVTLIMAGPDGKILRRAHASLSPDDESREKAPASLAKEPPLEFPETVKELARAYSDRSRKGFATLSTKLRGELSAPLAHDPLSLSILAGLPEYAERRNLNLVARPTDDYLASIYYLVSYVDEPEKKLLPARLKEIVAGQSMDWQESDGWLSIKPKRPHSTRQRQASRRLLAEFMNLTLSQRALNLDQQASFALRDEGRMGAHHMNEALSLLLPDQPSLHRLASRDEMLVLYGGLTTAQKQAIWSESGLRVSSLTGTQRQRADLMIFHGILADIQINGQRNRNDVNAFPTVVMPNGFPVEAVIKGAYKTEQMILGKFSEPKTRQDMPAVLSPGTIASYRHAKESGRPISRPAPDLYLPVTQHSGQFTFEFAPRVTLVRTFASYSIDKAAVFGAYDALPTAIKEIVEVELQKLRDKQAEANGTGSGPFPPQSP